LASTSRRGTAGQYLESWVDLLFVKGFDARPADRRHWHRRGAATELGARTSTYVPALDRAAYNARDDFLGSDRERLFGFVNGQIGADNADAQGFVHLVKDGHAAEDAAPATQG
jgi:hypothetical protein